MQLQARVLLAAIPSPSATAAGHGAAKATPVYEQPLVLVVAGLVLLVVVLLVVQRVISRGDGEDGDEEWMPTEVPVVVDETPAVREIYRPPSSGPAYSAPAPLPPPPAPATPSATDPWAAPTPYAPPPAPYEPPVAPPPGPPQAAPPAPLPASSPEPAPAYPAAPITPWAPQPAAEVYSPPSAVIPAPAAPPTPAMIPPPAPVMAMPAVEPVAPPPPAAEPASPPAGDLAPPPPPAPRTPPEPEPAPAAVEPAMPAVQPPPPFAAPGEALASPPGGLEDALLGAAPAGTEPAASSQAENLYEPAAFDLPQFTATPAPEPADQGASRFSDWVGTPVPEAPAETPSTLPPLAFEPMPPTDAGVGAEYVPADLAAPAPALQEPQNDAVQVYAPTPTPIADDPGRPQLILLIEDDERIAKFYTILFQAKGFAVENARDGVEGVDMATALKPALILLDVMMPKMNGLMVLQTLRANPETEHTPVVVLSNYMEPPLIQRALQLGAIEYVVKSQARPEQLVNALPHWLAGEPAIH